jgi:hypothetical protein
VTTGKLSEQVGKEVRWTFLYDFNYYCQGNVFVLGKQPFSLPHSCRKCAKLTNHGWDAFVSLSLHVFALQVHQAHVALFKVMYRLLWGGTEQTAEYVRLCGLLAEKFEPGTS